MQKKLEYANLQLFGDRRWKLKPKMTDGGLEKVDSDWKKEKDDYDGIDDAFCTDSVNNQSQEVKEPSKKERDLSDCLDEHKTMGVVGDPVEHLSDLTKVLILEKIFAFWDDGELSIDNNLAEQTIWKLITQRNKFFHYGSEVRVETAAIYYSVIGTVKLHGSSIWNFIGTFFKNIFNGCRDDANMIPDKITSATSQCWIQN